MSLENSDTHPTFQSTWFQSFRKPLFGFIAAMVSSLLNTAANILVKKTKFFNGFDNSAVRYVFQLIILMIIAKITHFKLRNQSSFREFLLGPKECLKLLIARGSISGIGLVCLYLSIKMISPADATSLFSCNIIFIVILSRIFMKEKFTILHVAALIFVIFGTLLITQPSYLVNLFSDPIAKVRQPACNSSSTNILNNFLNIRISGISRLTNQLRLL